MDRLCSSASSVPSIDDYFEHNAWNPLLDLLFFEQVSDIFASYLVEIDLTKIALSCHFALDVLCYKEEVLASARYKFLFHICLLPLAGAVSSRMVPYPYVALSPSVTGASLCVPADRARLLGLTLYPKRLRR